MGLVQHPEIAVGFQTAVIGEIPGSFRYLFFADVPSVCSGCTAFPEDADCSGFFNSAHGFSRFIQGSEFAFMCGNPGKFKC